MKVKRSKAAFILDYLRVAMAERTSPEEMEQYLQKQFGIVPLVICDGEAHTNPLIDNCLQCIPRWGFLGDKIEIT